MLYYRGPWCLPTLFLAPIWRWDFYLAGLLTSSWRTHWLCRLLGFLKKSLLGHPQLPLQHMTEGKLYASHFKRCPDKQHFCLKCWSYFESSAQPQSFEILWLASPAAGILWLCPSALCQNSRGAHQLKKVRTPVLMLLTAAQGEASYSMEMTIIICKSRNHDKQRYKDQLRIWWLLKAEVVGQVSLLRAS